MNPQQPYGAFPAPPQGNPYEFITGSPPKPPRTTGSRAGGGNSMVAKLVAFIGGAIVLIVVGFIVVNVFFGNKGNFTSIIGLAQSQQEIARIVNVGGRGISDPALAGAAANARLTLITQQNTLVTYLKNNKQNVDSKLLEKKKDSTVDKQFSQAKATSTLDLVFTQVLRQQLTDYAGELKSAYKTAPGNTARTLLNTDYEQTVMLLKQLPES